MKSETFYVVKSVNSKPLRYLEEEGALNIKTVHNFTKKMSQYEAKSVVQSAKKLGIEGKLVKISVVVTYTEL